MLADQGIYGQPASHQVDCPLPRRRDHGHSYQGERKFYVVENNHSGQFYRYMRSETGLSVDGHIRKYDGEPFMPHHIADGVKELLAGKTEVFVPDQVVIV